jgi:hypothetical protein
MKGSYKTLFDAIVQRVASLRDCAAPLFTCDSPLLPQYHKTKAEVRDAAAQGRPIFFIRFRDPNKGD